MHDACPEFSGSITTYKAIKNFIDAKERRRWILQYTCDCESVTCIKLPSTESLI